MRNDSLYQSLKEINSQIFWEQNKENKKSLKIEDEVIKAVKKYHQRAVNLAIAVGCVAGILFGAGAAIFKDTDKFPWRPSIITEVVGGGIIACGVGFALGYLTLKIAKYCSHPNLEKEEELRAYIIKILQDLKESANVPAEELAQYWDNDGSLNISAVEALVEKARQELNPPPLVQETTSLLHA